MERKYQLRKQTHDPLDYKFEDIAKTGKMPAFADLRDLMPEIFDQGQLGSCTANSTTAYDMYLHGNKIELSRLFQYFMTRKIENTIYEDSGASNRDAVKSVAKNGICEERYWIYDINKFTLTPTNEAVSNAQMYKSVTYHSVKGLTQIKQAIALHKLPVVLGMEVFESFEGEDIAKDGIMIMPKEGENNLGGHSTLVVGYVDNIKDLPEKYAKLFQGIKTKGFLIVRNSWGKDWGDKGYFYMPYEYITKHTFDLWTMQL